MEAGLNQPPGDLPWQLTLMPLLRYHRRPDPIGMRWLSSKLCHVFGERNMLQPQKSLMPWQRDPSIKWTAAAQANAGIAWMKLNRPGNRLLSGSRKRSPVRNPLQGQSLYTLFTAEILYRFKRFDESIALFRDLESKADATDIQEEVIRGIAWNYYARQDWAQACPSVRFSDATLS